MFNIPNFENFKKSIKKIDGKHYDVMYVANEANATFEIWHEETHYGNNTWGWQSRIAIHGKDYLHHHACASKCKTAQEAYYKMTEKASDVFSN